MEPHLTFQPYEGVVPGSQVRVGQKRARVGLRGDECEDEPQIILLREGDVVKAIEVICTCGKRIKMNCVF